MCIRDRGWSCYGCKAVEYLFGAGAGAGYRVLFVALMPLGAVMRLEDVYKRQWYI